MFDVATGPQKQFFQAYVVNFFKPCWTLPPPYLGSRVDIPGPPWGWVGRSAAGRKKKNGTLYDIVQSWLLEVIFSIPAYKYDYIGQFLGQN